MPESVVGVGANELGRLPARALVAFAARCARRVLPLYPESDERESEREERITLTEALEDAVTAAEICGESSRSQDQEGQVVNQDTTRAVLSEVALHVERAGKAFIRGLPHRDDLIVWAVSHALACARKTEESKPSEAAEHASDAALFAVKAISDVTGLPFDLGSSNAGIIGGADSEVVWDFFCLSETAEREKWSDDTPVPPAFFGPLWRQGTPPKWPMKEKPTGGGEIVLEIDVPEGVSDEEVAASVKDLVVILDDLDLAYGGHGLKLSGIEAEFMAPVPEEVPHA